jgi:hypothetical protein
VDLLNEECWIPADLQKAETPVMLAHRQRPNQSGAS